MSNRVINFSLTGAGGALIKALGGEVMICTAGTPDKITLVDAAGAALANPVPFTNGAIYAEIPKSNVTVDLYIRSPTGHFRVVKGHVPGSAQSYSIPTNDTHTTYVIPFSITDATAAVEKDSGFDLVTDAQVMPYGVGVEVTALDAAITLEAGILSSESGGDLDGFIDAISLAALGFVKAEDTMTAGGTETFAASTTLGALLNDFLAGANVVGDTGTQNKKAFRCNGTAKSISYTFLVAADTGKGFIVLPVQLGGAVALQSSAF